MGKTLEEIFEELNKPENKIKIINILYEEEKQRKETEENDNQPELSR